MALSPKPIAPTTLLHSGPRPGMGAPLATLLDNKIAALATDRSAEHVAQILHWVEALNEEDPTSARSVVDQLDALLERLTPNGLGRWILTGLRRYPNEAAQRRDYFRLADLHARQDLHSEAGALDVEQARAAMRYLLTALTGCNVNVDPRRQAGLNGPALRPILTRTHLLVPDSFTLLDGPDRAGLYRAVVAHAAAHLRYSLPGQPTQTLKPMSLALVSSIEDARVERLLARAYPGVQRWFHAFACSPGDDQDLSFAGLVGRLSRLLINPGLHDGNYWVNKARDLFEAQAGKDLRDVESFRKLASVLANDLGQMRVRFNAQAYSDPIAYRDDNSYLWDYGESMQLPPDAQDLNAGGVTPMQQNLTPSGRSDAGSTSTETEIGRFLYPEWDYKTQRARPDWCTVIEKIAAWRPASVSNTALSPARITLTRSRRLNRAKRLRRQWDGDDIDLNAAIEVLIDRRMNLAPDVRMFIRAGRQECIGSTLVLLDLSASSNDLVINTKLSILDMEKRAALTLARSITGGIERIAIHGFSSDTRAAINYCRLLDFGTPLSAVSAGVIEAAQARDSTRLGAALRHAGAHLSRETTELRSILVITDGTPSDIDVFDEQYLIQDTREAVLTLRKKGVRTSCIALACDAEIQLQKMFGWRNFHIVTDPTTLSTQLARCYARLTSCQP